MAQRERSSARPADLRRKTSGRPDLGTLVASRARALDRDAPDFKRRLLRLVVEASLLHEFGSHLLNAPKFQGIVEHVMHELESAPQMQDQVQRALQAVLSPSA